MTRWHSAFWVWNHSGFEPLTCIFYSFAYMFVLRCICLTCICLACKFSRKVSLSELSVSRDGEARAETRTRDGGPVPGAPRPAISHDDAQERQCTFNNDQKRPERERERELHIIDGREAVPW